MIIILKYLAMKEIFLQLGNNTNNQMKNHFSFFDLSNVSSASLNWAHKTS